MQGVEVQLEAGRGTCRGCSSLMEPALVAAGVCLKALVCAVQASHLHPALPSASHHYFILLISPLIPLSATLHPAVLGSPDEPECW